MSIFTRKKLELLMVSLMGITVLLAACGGNNSNNTEVSEATQGQSEENLEHTAEVEEVQEVEQLILTDSLGNKVEIPNNPQRIIATYLEDHLVALGVKPVAQWSVTNGVQEYLQKDLEGVPTISYDLPFEEVTSFDPDLLILGSDAAAEGDKYAQYAKIATTFTLGDKISNDWRKSLLKVGEILNKNDEAKEALAQYDKKAKEAKDKLKETIGEQSAAAIWLVQKQFYVVSENVSSGAVIYHDLGFVVPDLVEEVSLTATGNWNSVSLEKLAEMDVDNIFLINSDKGAGSEALEDQIWKNIPAVKNNQVFEFDRSHSWLYTGAIANSQIIDDILNSLIQ